MTNLNPKSKPATIREIKDNAPYSNYQLYSYILSSLSIFITGLEFTLYSNLSTLMKTKLNLSTFENILLNSVIFLGFSFGSMTAGNMESKRTLLLKYSPFIILFSHIIMIFFLNEISMIIIRILIGLGLGFCLPTSIIIFIEYRNIYYRNFHCLFIWIFYILPSFIQCLLIFIIMPNYEEKRIKILLFILTIFVIVQCFFNFFFSFDSPRHLIYLRENEKGFEILKNINKRNIITEEEKRKITNDIFDNNAFKHVENKLVYLMNHHNQNTTLILIYFLFTISFSLISLYNLNHLTKISIYGIQLDLNKKIILNQLIINVICLIGMIPLCYIIETFKIGRKKTMSICFFFSSIFSFISIILKSMYPIFIGLNLIFSLTSLSITITYIVEFFCMRIRDLALGFLIMIFSLSCFFSNVILYIIHNKNYKIAYYLIASLCFISFLLSFLLSYETGNRPLDSLYMENYHDGFSSESKSNDQNEQEEEEEKKLLNSENSKDNSKKNEDLISASSESF